MKTLLRVYIGLSLIVILQVWFLVSEGMSFRGYWSDKIVVWIWLAMTVTVIAAFRHKKVARIYVIVLLIVLAVSFIPFGLPIFSFYTFITASDRTQVSRVHQNVRVQTVGRSPMVGYRTEVISEGLFLERIVGDMPQELSSSDSSVYLKDVVRFSMKLETPDSFSIVMHFRHGSLQEKFPY